MKVLFVWFLLQLFISRRWTRVYYNYYLEKTKCTRATLIGEGGRIRDRIMDLPFLMLIFSFSF